MKQPVRPTPALAEEEEEEPVGTQDLGIIPQLAYLNTESYAKLTQINKNLHKSPHLSILIWKSKQFNIRIMHRICKWGYLPPPREENMWQPACVCLTMQTRVIMADIFALSQAEVTICEKMSFSLINVRRSVNTQQDNNMLFSSTCMLSFISTDMNEAAETEQSERV